jgi:SAM-dependent methyltransferase
MRAPGIIWPVLKGKTIYRTLFDRQVWRTRSFVRGIVLDVAGDARADYAAALRSSGATLTVVNVRSDADVVADFNLPLPFPDQYADTVLLFNALYIADDQRALFKELRRITKKDGHVLIASPFVSNEMREPHDYVRLTSEGLSRLCKESGLRILSCESIGERFTSAAYLLHPFFLISPIRLIAYMLALVFDHCIPRSIRIAHPAPLGYFLVCTPQESL